MKKFLSQSIALSIAALIGLTTVLAATPANADTSDPPAQLPELSAQGGRLDAGCRDVSISYNFLDDNWPLNDWHLTVDVFAPDGDFSDTDYFSGTGSVASGTMDALVCQFEGFGEYRVEARINWQDEDENTLATDSATTTFLMTKPPTPVATPVKSPKARTATTITISDSTPRPRQIVIIGATSSVMTEASWKRNRGAVVALEKHTSRGWVRWRGMKQFTNGRGKVTWKTRVATRKPLALRAVTMGTSGLLASHSRTIRIK